MQPVPSEDMCLRSSHRVKATRGWEGAQWTHILGMTQHLESSQMRCIHGWTETNIRVGEKVRKRTRYVTHRGRALKIRAKYFQTLIVLLPVTTSIMKEQQPSYRGTYCVSRTVQTSLHAVAHANPVTTCKSPCKEVTVAPAFQLRKLSLAMVAGPRSHHW